MSIGNTNFITLDSIAEIQDIADGDYVFTVSNGVIYKLDFQNFVIPLQNVDFATTIESMSAQLVSLTNAFSAVNTTVNALSALTSIPELSANWTSTWETVNTLSATNWLPDIDKVSPGSVVYYEGGNSGWKYTQQGKEGNVLTVKNAVPTFAGSSTFTGVNSQSITYQYTDTNSTDYPIIETMSFSTQQEWAALQINWDVSWKGGAITNIFRSGKKYASTIKNLSRLYIKYDPTAEVPDTVHQSGLVYLPAGTNGPAPVQFMVIPQLEVTLTEDPNDPAADLRTSYLVGEATSLGNTGNGQTRWKETDPAIIGSVIDGVIPGGLPSTNSNIPYHWDFNTGKQLSFGGVTRNFGQDGPVYNKCTVTLSIQGR